jgi:hypothetical protein
VERFSRNQRSVTDRYPNWMLEANPCNTRVSVIITLLRFVLISGARVRNNMAILSDSNLSRYTLPTESSSCAQPSTLFSSKASSAVNHCAVSSGVMAPVTRAAGAAGAAGAEGRAGVDPTGCAPVLGCAAVMAFPFRSFPFRRFSRS